MHASLSCQTPSIMVAESSVFRFDELLCTELLTRLQGQLPPGVRQICFGCINGCRAALYAVNGSRVWLTLWLYEDDARDWFVARYYHDMQLMQEIEQEILAEFGAQLMERRRG